MTIHYKRPDANRYVPLCFAWLTENDELTIAPEKVDCKKCIARMPERSDWEHDRGADS